MKKEKIYAVCKTKTFRNESYGEPELTLCKTRKIAEREFRNSIKDELEEYLTDSDLYSTWESNEADGSLYDMSLEEQIELYSEHHFEVDFCEKTGQEHCSFQTSDESSTSFSIIETEMITE